ncbi:predicted protein [Nematostella vectensis]|uniref:Uncharacterized protein n=1 Tax=Nematostella vectensis TaxID=45351 RepID=A8DUR0_NEMVE|nr:predicted protein [Nematostella vectensis]|eukprot:XP_001620426.1 hypothetical protein NEMVEDRAFT_v1g223130 [Nematostella vectensis]
MAHSSNSHDGVHARFDRLRSYSIVFDYMLRVTLDKANNKRDKPYISLNITNLTTTVTVNTWDLSRSRPGTLGFIQLIDNYFQETWDPRYNIIQLLDNFFQGENMEPKVKTWDPRYNIIQLLDNFFQGKNMEPKVKTWNPRYNIIQLLDDFQGKNMGPKVKTWDPRYNIIQLLNNFFQGDDGNALAVLSSSGNDDWISVDYVQADPKGPEFSTKFENTQQSVRVKFSSIQLTAVKEALAAFEIFLLELLESDDVKPLTPLLPSKFQPLETIEENEQLETRAIEPDTTTIVQQLYGQKDTTTIVQQLYGEKDTTTIVQQLYGKKDTTTIVHQLYGKKDKTTIVQQLYGKKDTTTIVQQLYGQKDTTTIVQQLYGQKDTMTIVQQLYGEKDTTTIVQQLYVNREVVDMAIEAHVVKISIKMVSRQKLVGCVHVKGLKVKIEQRGPETKIVTMLKDLGITNAMAGTFYPKILCLEDNTVFECEITLFDNKSNSVKDPLAVDVLIDLKIGRFKFVFLSGFTAHMQVSLQDFMMWGF